MTGTLHLDLEITHQASIRDLVRAKITALEKEMLTDGLLNEWQERYSSNYDISKNILYDKDLHVFVVVELQLPSLLPLFSALGLFCHYWSPHFLVLQNRTQSFQMTTIIIILNMSIKFNKKKMCIKSMIHKHNLINRVR